MRSSPRGRSSRGSSRSRLAEAGRAGLRGGLPVADHRPRRSRSTPITWPTSTGPRAGRTATPARLIDSNLDWGQDLVGAPRVVPARIAERDSRSGWPTSVRSTRRCSRSGEIPSTGSCPRCGRDRPCRCRGTAACPRPKLIGPARRLTPGYYAVSATLVHGLPWRLYDPSPMSWEPVMERVREGRLRLLPSLPARRQDRAFDLRLQAQPGGCGSRGRWRASRRAALYPAIPEAEVPTRSAGASRSRACEPSATDQPSTGFSPMFFRISARCFS